jgi:hypothetical protein
MKNLDIYYKYKEKNINLTKIYKLMKKNILIPVIIILMIGVLTVALMPEKSSMQINPGQRVITGRATISNPPPDVNYGNIASYLSDNQVIKDIPDNANIFLRFFNFNSGKREYEKSFILTKGHVEEGYLENPDLTLIIHSKYLEQWNSANFCNIMSSANKNGDLAYNSELSSAKLLWKFKSMNGHKSCFGI